MHPLRAIVLSAAVLAPLAPMACSSKTTTVTSGGAHYEIVPGTSSAGCDDFGKQVTISTKGDDGKDKLIIDGADGATVQCQYDDKQFRVTIINNQGSLVSGGTISGNQSTDATLDIQVLGAEYKTLAPCTVTFTNKANNALEGHFVCPDIQNQRTAKECAITFLLGSGLSASYFKFNDCTGF